ncbi:MAG: hypothetical protein ACRETL_08185, partial [Gammaproteobacteria bacterium]
MKTTVRIVTLALALGLASALTTAWGAESVGNLISQGESVITAVNSAKAARDAAVQKNNALAAEGKQITAEEQQINAGIAALNQRASQVKSEAADYEQSCVKTKPPTQDKFNACKAQQVQVKDDIAAVNAQPAKLKQQQDAWVGRATKYNQEIKDAPKQVRVADTAYRNTIPALEDWNNAARTMVASAAFQPYAKKVGCPN